MRPPGFSPYREREERRVQGLGRDHAMFSGDFFFGRKFTLRAEKLLGTYSYQTSPKVSDFHPTDWLEKYLSGQSAKRNSNTSGTGLVRISAQARGVSALEVDFRPKLKKKKVLARKYRVIPTSRPWHHLDPELREASGATKAEGSSSKDCYARFTAQK